MAEKGSIVEAMKLWDTYNEKYRTMIPNILRLLEEKDKLNLTLRNREVNRAIKEWPEIPFLDIADRNIALSYLKGLNERQVRWIIRQIIDWTEENTFAYKTISNKTKDYVREIEQKKRGRPGAWG